MSRRPNLTNLLYSDDIVSDMINATVNEQNVDRKEQKKYKAKLIHWDEDTYEKIVQKAHDYRMNTTEFIRMCVEKELTK